MFFNPQNLPAREVYKLLAGTIVPRPIALVSSLGEGEVVNAAPFSFFNILGSDPPIVALGIGDRAPGVGKDSARNIEKNGEFVVNLVDENLAAAMNVCAVDFPPEQSEIAAANLELAPSQIVRTPRLSASPASFECRLNQILRIGNNRIVLGEIVGIWGRDEFFDAQKFHVATEKMELIGRMGGAGGYCKTTQTFEMPRQSYEEWRQSSTPRETS